MASKAQEPSLPGSPGLPYVPTSDSELLASTHILLVKVKSVSFSEWKPGDDHLLHRSVLMEIELVETFKGTLDPIPGGRFRLEVQQSRENEYVAYDYHGFWSHEEPAPGSRLVLSKSETRSAVDALREPAIQRMLAPELTADVRAAIAAERLWLRPNRESEKAGTGLDAALRMLDFARKSRAELHDLFARYLWDRVQTVFKTHEDEMLPPIWGLIEARDAETSFRSALLASLYRSTILFGATPERCSRLLPRMFALLLRDDATALHDELVEVQIYNLLFRPDRRPPPVTVLIPDAAERTKLATAVAGYSTLRSREILNWLRGSQN